MSKLIPSRLRIINYRSIKDLTLNLDKDLRILVGKNESGKTNILSAIATLDKSCKFDAKSVRMGTSVSEKSVITYQFSVSLLEVLAEIESKIYNDEVLGLLKSFANKNRVITVEYEIDIRSNERSFSFEIPDNLLEDKEYFIIQSRQGAVSIAIRGTQDRKTLDTQNNSIIIDSEKYETSSCVTNTDRTRVINIIKSLIQKTFVIPNVLYWKYSNENLLPGMIDVQKFISNPSSCIPLMNIFEAVGVKDIKAEYDDKIKQDSNAWPNFLEDITKKINKYIKKIWSTPAKLKIEAYGDSNIRISIKDAHNSYSLSERSDGYKRMLTFITMLSARNTTSKIKDYIIVIDEPDATVDIPGTKFLLDELIRISADNYVLVSTHSPSLIDPRNISRHLIVSKRDELTTALVANESNYNSADTLYEGLGMQYYAQLNEINVAFEGWTDKRLFDVYVGNSSNKEFKKISTTFTGGVDNFSNFASLWMTIAKKPTLLLVSDNDDKAIANKANYDKLNKPILWRTYSDLCNSKAKTAESFLKDEYIRRTISKYLKSIDKGLSKKIDLEDCDGWDSMEKAVRKVLNREKTNGSNSDPNNVMFNIKQELYQDLTSSDILDEYENFLNNLVAIL